MNDYTDRHGAMAPRKKSDFNYLLYGIYGPPIPLLASSQLDKKLPIKTLSTLYLNDLHILSRTFQKKENTASEPF